jgi:hypothetical protein
MNGALSGLAKSVTFLPLRCLSGRLTIEANAGSTPPADDYVNFSSK